MSFILVPKHGEDIQVNAWNWRPTLELLRNENLLTQDEYERIGANGCGGQVKVELACHIADVVERRLFGMKPGERLLIDQTIAAHPKKQVTFTPAMKSDDIEAIDPYSASYEWLVTFRDFCRSSGGFEVL